MEKSEKSLNRPTLFFNGAPVFQFNIRIIIIYKSENKSQDEIKQMKLKKDFRDFDKIFYNFDNMHKDALFKLISEKIEK